MGWGSVFKEVEIVIVQPRCRHKDGVVRRWTVPAEDLDAFAKELGEMAKIATSKNARLNPGDHCRFCPAQAVCPAIADKTLAMARTDFTALQTQKTVVLPEPQALTKEDLSTVLKFTPVIEGWLKAVEGYALQLLQNGADVPGFKLVKKRAFRAWKSEDEAASVLSMYLSDDQLWEKKMLSPAKVDKILKKDKKIVEALITVPDNGTTIAPTHDPREQVQGSADAGFAKIEQGE